MLFNWLLSDNEKLAIKIGYLTINEYQRSRNFRRSMLGQLVTEIIQINENRKSKH